MNMQSRSSSSSIDENKIVGRLNPSRALPLKILRLFVLFLCITFLCISLYTIRHFDVRSLVTTVHPSFRPCFREPTGLDRWIESPLNVIHTMTDEELFWRATFVPKISKYPFERFGKIAFMFLSKGPLPLSPLWEKFFQGHEGLYSIYIHSFPSFHAKLPLSSVFYGRQVPSKVAEWGKMSLCNAERRLLANALLDFSNEYFVLVSESCIPLYNFSTIYEYISKSNYSFVGVFDDKGPFGRGRYNENMSPLVNITQWRKGSQWFEVNRGLAVNMVEDAKYYESFEKFCKPACYVDEHYFQTMLTIQSGGVLANRSLTMVDWSRGGAHPASFGRLDITERFLKKLREGSSCIYNGRPSSVCFLFARKFSPNTLEPLMRLGLGILGY